MSLITITDFSVAPFKIHKYWKTDLYDHDGRVHECKCHEQRKKALDCLYEEVLSVFWIWKLLKKKMYC